MMFGIDNSGSALDTVTHSAAMAGNDLRQDFLPHKPCRPVARCALLIRQKFFDGVIIERGHVVWISFTFDRHHDDGR